MKEAMISAVIKRVGKSPLERLSWAVDFSRRQLLTDGDQSNAELELTCFLWALNLRPDSEQSVPAQIKTLMTEDAFHGQEITQAQRRFTEILRAAAGDGKIEQPLHHVKVVFTRAEGLEYSSSIRSFPTTPAGEEKARLEAVIFKLLRLLDKTVRSSIAKSKGGERFTPVRMYVGICPEDKDGCGRLYAKTRSDQEYCSRTCVNRAQVNRFRRNERDEYKAEVQRGYKSSFRQWQSERRKGRNRKKKR